MARNQAKRLTKREKRRLRQEGLLDCNVTTSANFAPKLVQPITDNQKLAFKSWHENCNLMLHGVPGTGKTFLALYFAISAVMKHNTPYEKVYIIRSTVPAREQGFLPGSQKQKESVYEDTYYGIAEEIFGRKDGYGILKQKDLVEFKSTSNLRGVTFRNCILVVDEVQNMNDQELHTIITRVGENCRIVFSGDVKQDDLTSERKKEVSGLRNFMKIIQKMEEFDFIEFSVDDIVRSDLVKSYIVARDELGM